MDRAKGRLNISRKFYYLIWIVCADRKGDRVHTSQILVDECLPFHDRLASGPMSPRPSTLEPSVKMQSVFHRFVYSKERSWFFATAKLTAATPGVYQIEKSSRLVTGTFGTVCIFPS